ncbi:hypothetical protein BRYFOR_06907 [Marvinbryantia formatexigens DSM 14469]|uniref:Uncharacterized protein n=1 Tax=Marvinbryantia formatexigens DSM 14469 TaxID=478749 RepID=C6LE58_9FIRM|nr:hypothetical protein [Marvinbryantia formatexigens]EET61262.1 hypothetical protein BRYFOR_06907 [Marvinbryantia formatexigens DSM 14469]UWO23800.1 hypothetical protein NQ534_15320 [Marvinbryantia formatexigens DSM 14469]SDF71437.1 hypothetical protein SAMN05660368_01201 [Marvinbryantia formatexigens]
MTNTQKGPVKKAAGFYVGIIAAVLCIASAVVYGMKFSSITYKEKIYDSNVCLLLGITAAVAIIMLLINKIAAYAPVVLCAGSGIACLMFVRLMIWPISDTIYGIEPFQHMNELYTCAALLVLSFVFSEISLYMKKTKVKAA